MQLSTRNVFISHPGLPPFLSLMWRICTIWTNTLETLTSVTMPYIFIRTTECTFFWGVGTSPVTVWSITLSEMHKCAFRCRCQTFCCSFTRQIEIKSFTYSCFDVAKQITSYRKRWTHLSVSESLHLKVFHILYIFLSSTNSMKDQLLPETSEQQLFFKWYKSVGTIQHLTDRH